MPRMVGRAIFVEKHGKMQFACKARPELAAGFDRTLERGVAQGDERRDVESAKTGMSSLVPGEVYASDGDAG